MKQGVDLRSQPAVRCDFGERRQAQANQYRDQRQRD